jgi:CheY-like chemotaxis protein
MAEATYRYTLVVGEDTKERAWLEGILIRGGLEVAACSEAELLATPDLVPPQLVLLEDSRSGGNDPEGPQRAQRARLSSFDRIRAQPALAGVPVVMLAPDADIESYSAVIERGAAAYLVKPAAAEEVVRIAHKISGWLSSNDRTERRRRLRRPLVMQVDAELAGRAPVPGQIVDVSSGGCRVELPAPVTEGEAAKLTVRGLESPSVAALSAEVRWRRETQGGAQLVGMRFTGTSAAFAGRLLGAVPRHARSG